MTNTETTWRKATRSGSESNCIEVRNDLDAVRDSKNIDGPTLRVNVPALVRAIQAGLDR